MRSEANSYSLVILDTVGFATGVQNLSSTQNGVILKPLRLKNLSPLAALTCFFLLLTSAALAQPGRVKQNIFAVNLGTGPAWVSDFELPWSGYIGLTWSAPHNHHITVRALRIVDIEDGLSSYFTKTTPARNAWDIGLLYGRDLPSASSGGDKGGVWRMTVMTGISVVRLTNEGGILPEPGLYTEATQSSIGLPVELWLKRNIGTWSYISIVATSTFSKFKPHVSGLLMLTFPVRAV